MRRYFRPAILTLLLASGLIGNYRVALAVSVLAALMILHSVLDDWPRVHSVIVGSTLIFGAIAFRALLTARSSDYANDKFATLFTATLLTALAASLFRDEQDVTDFAQLWVAGAIVLSLAVVVTGVGGVGREYILGVNPIWLARVPASALVMVVWARVTHRLALLPALAIAGLFGLAVIMTGSKGPLLAAVVASFAITIAVTGPTAGRIAASTMALGATYLALTNGPLSRTRVGRFASDPFALQDVVRELALARSWGILQEHTFWGVGLGNWPLEAGLRGRLYPHNIWVEMSTELGLVLGVALSLWFLVISVRLWRRAKHQPVSSLVLGLLLCEMVNSTVSGDINARSLWFYSLLGLWVSSRHFGISAARSATGSRELKRATRPVTSMKDQHQQPLQGPPRERPGRGGRPLPAARRRGRPEPRSREGASLPTRPAMPQTAGG